MPSPDHIGARTARARPRIRGGLTLATALFAASATLSPVLAQSSTKEAGTASKKPAEPAPPAAARAAFFDATFGARVVSDYNFRGISQSALQPGVQGYVEGTVFEGLVYGGIAAYSVRLPTKPSAEIDLTAGIRPKFGPFSFDFGAIYYLYPRERTFSDPIAGIALTPKDTDYVEIVGKASYTFQDALTLGVNAYRGFDYLRSGVDNTYVAATARYLVPESLMAATPLGAGSLAISGEIGRHSFSGLTKPLLGAIKLPSYTYGNVGLAYTYKNATLDLRYHDTNLSKANCFALTTDPKGVFTGSGRSNWCGPAFVATVSLDFTASALGIFVGK